MDITMLGTGNALVTECYNTCFVLREDDRYLLVDGGGGSTILRQLKYAGFCWMDMREIFITHKHADHLLGIVWMVRMICQYMNRGQYAGEATIYGHQEVLDILLGIVQKLLSEKETRWIGERLYFVAVHDGEERIVMGRKVTFFDIGSTKTKQYGFSMELDNEERLTCCGDEPYRDSEKKYAENVAWLLHEAFCLSSEADIFKPYEKHHSTVKDACRLAQQLHVKNLLLYHTEDKNIKNRKEKYLAEGKEYFSGNLYIPEDLESITI